MKTIPSFGVVVGDKIVFYPNLIFYKTKNTRNEQFNELYNIVLSRTT